MLSVLTKKKKKKEQDTKILWEVLIMSITLIEVTVFWCVHISEQVKYVQFLVYRLHLNKAGLFFF